MESSLLIYALTDPRTDEVRYVGKSCSGMYRPTKHLQPKALAKDDTYKGRWLRELLAAGHRPGMHAVAIYEDRAALEQGERQWIAYGFASCWPLTNCTKGGDGLRDPSPETRAKMSASRRGKPSGRKGCKHTPETLAKMAAARVGRKLTPEHRAKIGAAHKGTKRPDGTGGRISAALLGRKRTPEQRARIVDGMAAAKARRAVSHG